MYGFNLKTEEKRLVIVHELLHFAFREFLNKENIVLSEELFWKVLESFNYIIFNKAEELSLKLESAKLAIEGMSKGTDIFKKQLDIIVSIQSKLVATDIEKKNIVEAINNLFKIRTDILREQYRLAEEDKTMQKLQSNLEKITDQIEKESEAIEKRKMDTEATIFAEKERLRVLNKISELSGYADRQQELIKTAVQFEQERVDASYNYSQNIKKINSDLTTLTTELNNAVIAEGKRKEINSDINKLAQELVKLDIEHNSYLDESIHKEKNLKDLIIQRQVAESIISVGAEIDSMEREIEIMLKSIGLSDKKKDIALVELKYAQERNLVQGQMSKSQKELNDLYDAQFYRNEYGEYIKLTQIQQERYAVLEKLIEDYGASLSNLNQTELDNQKVMERKYAVLQIFETIKASEKLKESYANVKVEIEGIEAELQDLKQTNTSAFNVDLIRKLGTSYSKYKKQLSGAYVEYKNNIKDIEESQEAINTQIKENGGNIDKIAELESISNALSKEKLAWVSAG